MVQTFDDDEFAGCKFDEFLNIHPDGREALFEVLRPACDCDRERARTAVGVERFKLTLGLVIANAIRANAHPDGPACFYIRTNFRPAMLAHSLSVLAWSEA